MFEYKVQALAEKEQWQFGRIAQYSLSDSSNCAIDGRTTIERKLGSANYLDQFKSNPHKIFKNYQFVSPNSQNLPYWFRFTSEIKVEKENYHNEITIFVLKICQNL